MDRPPRESSPVRGPSSGHTTTAVAPTTSAPGQIASLHEADRQAQRGGDAATATQALESPSNTGPTATAPNTNNPPPTARPKQHKHLAERPGKLHTRVPSYKGKQHYAAPKLVSRRSYHHDESQANKDSSSRHLHRRAHSDAKLVHNAAPAPLSRNKSVDKLRAPAAGGKPRPHAGPGPSSDQHPSAVQYGPEGDRNGNGDEDDDDEDEWVDDSATASPYPRTPREPPPPRHPRTAALSPVPSGGTPSVSSADRDIAQHKEYLTSRLLRRIPSQNAAPTVSAAMASAPRSHRNSPDTISQDSTAPATPNVVSGGEEEEGLTSRFLTRPESTFGRDGSFYTHDPALTAGRSLDDAAALRRPRSMTELSREDSARRDASAGESSEGRSRRRGFPAEISRTQQKLNLQRASSVIEPQPPAAAPSMIGSTATLVGMPTPGYDGVSGRDPRLSRVMEKTGMEYRVVRRYQNPLLRSVSRLEDVPGWAGQRVVPRPGHARNSSLPPLRDEGSRPSTPLRAQTSRGGPRELLGREGINGDGARRGNGDGGVAAALRNLWEKPLDLSASQ